MYIVSEVAYACTGEALNLTHCDKQSLIKIYGAFYGDMGKFINCSQDSISSVDFRVNIQDYNESFYDFILDQCDGKQSCNNTQVNEVPAEVDYVMIIYTCEKGKVQLSY